MKALTLTQPWAWLICTGRKRFETRSWRTHHRGPIAIHAAATVNSTARTYARERNIDLTSLPFGQIVAIATILDCVTTEEVRDTLSAQERDAGDYGDGRWAWKLSDIRVLATPIPAKGTLGLWSWDETSSAAGVPPASCGAGVPPARMRTEPAKSGHLP